MNAQTAQEIVDKILKGGPDAQKAADTLVNIAVVNSADVANLDQFMTKEIAPRFEERIFSSKQGVGQNIQVVAIVALVNTQDKISIATFDKHFSTQLQKNENAAVRYWAAKGLVNLIPKIANAGPVTKNAFINSFKSQAAVETSMLAQAQMVRGLAGFGDVVSINEVLSKNADRYRIESINGTDADALTAELVALAEAMKTNPPKGKDLAESVRVAAWLASFAVQHAAAAALNGTADAAKALDGAKDIANQAVVIFNLATKPGTFPPIKSKDVNNLFDEVQTLTKKTIQAQPDLKGVPAPLDIDTSGASSSTPAKSAPAAPSLPTPTSTATRPKGG